MGRNEDRYAGGEEALPVREDQTERESPSVAERPAESQETGPGGVERELPSAGAGDAAGEEDLPSRTEIERERQAGEP